MTRAVIGVYMTCAKAGEVQVGAGARAGRAPRQYLEDEQNEADIGAAIEARAEDDEEVQDVGK